MVSRAALQAGHCSTAENEKPWPAHCVGPELSLIAVSLREGREATRDWALPHHGLLLFCCPSTGLLPLVEISECGCGALGNSLANAVGESSHPAHRLFELFDIKDHQRVVGAGVRNPGVLNLGTRK